MKQNTQTGFGGAAQAHDGFDFLKRMWGGGMPMPGIMTPTTDLNELEKRIADLKAVEQWLNLNLNMLRATIQGLEVQHGTLAALQAFGNSFQGHSTQSNTAQSSPTSNTGSTTPKHNTQAIEEASASMVNTATAWWNLMQEQFNGPTKTNSPSNAKASEPTNSSTSSTPLQKKAEASTNAAHTKTSKTNAAEPKRARPKTQSTGKSTP